MQLPALGRDWYTLRIPIFPGRFSILLALLFSSLILGARPLTFLQQAEHCLVDGDIDCARYCLDAAEDLELPEVWESYVVLRRYAMGDVDHHTAQLSLSQSKDSLLFHFLQFQKKEIKVSPEVANEWIKQAFTLLPLELNFPQSLWQKWQVQHSEYRPTILQQLLLPCIIDQLFLCYFHTEQISFSEYFLNFQYCTYLLDYYQLKSNDLAEASNAYAVTSFLMRYLQRNGLLSPQRKRRLQQKWGITDRTLQFYFKNWSETPNAYWFDRFLSVLAYDKAPAKLSIRDGWLVHLRHELENNLLKVNGALQADTLSNAYRMVLYKQRDQYQLALHQMHRILPPAASAKRLDDRIRETDAVLAFHDSPEILYSAYVHEDNQYLQATSKSEDLRNSLQGVSDYFAHPVEALDGQELPAQRFARQSHLLYQQLLAKPLRIGSPEHLIVVPDGLLLHIPFGSLNTSEDASDYLIQRLSISYAHDLAEVDTRAVIPVRNIAAFAPVRFAENLPPLPAIRQEIQHLQDQFSTTVVPRLPFVAPPVDADLWHIATHGTTRHPRLGVAALYGQDTICGITEVSTHRNPQALILSTCESGPGAGYALGALNFERAFARVGCSSRILSLSPLEDRSTARLMQYFYNACRQHDSHRALQLAKLKYLEQADAYRAQPVFWASMVAYGQAFRIE